MASLTFSELKKRSGRIETLIRLFDSGHKFKMNKSIKKFKISSIILVTNSKKWVDINKKDINTKAKEIKAIKRIRNHKGSLKYLGVIGSEKTEVYISAGKLLKSKEFGGGGSSKGGGSETLAVRAETLIKDGKLEKIEYAGVDVECRTFKSIKELKKSILNGLKKNKKIPSYIIESFNDYLCENCKKFDNISWSESMPNNELNQLGKYVGEVITGLIAMGGPRNSLTPNIIKTNKIKKFCVPTDPAFSGIDVFLLMNDGSIVPISNKYGKGAAASFFTNVLPKCMKHYKTLHNSPLKKITKIANSFSSENQMRKGTPPSKKILYEYGIRELLNIPYRLLKNPYDVYNDARTNKYSAEVHLVMEAIKEHRGVDKVVVDNLPLSITSFFTREIAKALNNNKKAIDDMKIILAGKNYWQANLQIGLWSEGRIKYKLVNSGKIKLDIIGTKSSSRDLTAKQGLLNYFMTLP